MILHRPKTSEISFVCVLQSSTYIQTKKIENLRSWTFFCHKMENFELKNQFNALQFQKFRGRLKQNEMHLEDCAVGCHFCRNVHVPH